MKTDSNDVLLAKASIIERCIRRIREEYEAAPDLQDWTHVDAMTLNVERACQAAIDMAMYMVSNKHLGVPNSSAEAFRLLQANDHIPDELADKMEGMVGFRNIAVHQYKKLDTSVLRWIAERGWRDMVHFCRELGVEIQP